MVLVQKEPFFQLFFLGKMGQKNIFHDILDRKNAFLGYKNKKLKISKNRNFSKRVNPWFWSKNGHFSNFFFQAKWARKMSFTIFQNGKMPLQAIKTRSSKIRKIDILFKGVNPSFWFKNAHFSNYFFLGKMGQENIFYDILQRNNAFLGYKNEKFKKWEN